MTLRKRIITLALLVVMCVSMGGALFSAFSIRTGAADAVTSYDTSPIESDMANMEEAEYPANPLGECSIIGFMENCYSEDEAHKEYYGLYVYVYNPSEKELRFDEGKNQIQISTGFGADGKANSFDNRGLTFLDHTDNHRFYKFKVTKGNELYSVEKEYSTKWNGKRRYEITSLDVHFVGNDDPEESIGISKIYEFTGYAAYMQSLDNPISTLQCKFYGKQDIHLKVYDTHYRFAHKGDYLYDDLQSVYFSVPQEYISQWGDMCEIKAEWYQYRTAPMFVTSDLEAYSSLFELINCRINEKGQLIDSLGNILDENVQTKWRILWEMIDLSDVDFSCYRFAKAYNGEVGPFTLYMWGLLEDYQKYTKLDWLFPVLNVTSNDSYDISSDEVKAYIKKYANKFPEQEKLHDKYPVDLFVREDGDGYKSKTFSIDDVENYTDASKDQSFWNKFWFGVELDSSLKYSPIQLISEGDLYLEEADFSSKYFVDDEDVTDVIKFAQESYEKGELPYLLRFALNDYYACEARFDYVEDSSIQDISSPDGYVAQEMVYLDFDILSLGFSRDKGYTKTVVGVVATSIDIINGLTAPEGLYEEQEWWQKIMMVLALIAVVVILIFFFGPLGFVFKIIWTGFVYIIKFPFTILTIPIRIIGWFFKKI